MLDKLEAVLRLSATGEWSVVFGDLPEAAVLTDLAAMAKARPAARKLSGGMAIAMPMSAGRWTIWLLSVVPPVSELAAIMSRLQELTSGLDRLEPTAAAAPTLTGPTADAGQTSDALSRLRKALPGASRPKIAILVSALLEQLVDSGVILGGAVIAYREDRQKKLWLSDARYRGHRKEIGMVAAAARGEAPLATIVEADSGGDDWLEASILARQFDADSVALVLPERSASGYGVIAFGAKDLSALQLVSDLCAIVAPIRSRKLQRRRQIRFAVAAAVIGALAVWLALPAPVTVSTTGETVAADMSIVALPAAAFLKRVHVSTGQVIGKGQLVAEFDSPELQEALAEERLNATVETLSAQAALAENRYSDYQLSTERLAIVNTRISQIQDRIAALRVVAPVDGRIVEAVSDSITGAYFQTGQQIVAIQTSDAINMRLRVSRMDANLVRPDMAGRVYLRGLAERSFALTVLSPATVREDPQTRTETVEAMAEVIAPQGVIVGMSGFARLDGPTAPRIVGLGRYAMEFLREETWTILGLKF